MLKNSKLINFISIVCYILGLASLGFFVYELVKNNGNYNSNLALFIGLLVASVMLITIAIVLNPPKMFNQKTAHFTGGLVLFLLAGLALAFLIYNCVTQFHLTTVLICAAVVLVGMFFGTILLKIAKQDINVDARIKQEQKVLDEKKAEERANLKACPYCGCRLTPQDEVCPNCKSKL